MRRKMIFGLILLNGLLLAAILTRPAWTQVFPTGLWNCCEYELAPEPYCCEQCCWFERNCKGDADCQISAD